MSILANFISHAKPNCRELISNLRNRRGYFTKPRVQFTEDTVDAESAHPWPEWTALLDKLSDSGYFGTTDSTTNDINLIKNACINFARHRYDIIRYLSPNHVLVLAGSGCPSTDEKIVNSGKRLRAHFNIDELNVCGSCILSGECERAFLRAPKGEGGRTVDVMRFLVQYGLDPLKSSVHSAPHLNNTMRGSAKVLLKEMLEFSSEPVSSQSLETSSSGSELSVQSSAQDQTDAPTPKPKPKPDWFCPKCNFQNFARNIRCLCCDHLSEERLKKLREEENLPLKKGDWICKMCHFLNFAKNSRCLRCKERPPKRVLILGEWECESCYYINFRRNTVCLKCDNRRPIQKTRDSRRIDPASNHVIYQRPLPPVFGKLKHSEDRHTMLNLTRTENNKNEKSDSRNQIPVLLDFPVLGGKSNLSRDVQIQERWKEEIKLRRENVKRDRNNADDSKCSMQNKDGKP